MPSLGVRSPWLDGFFPQTFEWRRKVGDWKSGVARSNVWTFEGTGCFASIPGTFILCISGSTETPAWPETETTEIAVLIPSSELTVVTEWIDMDDCRPPLDLIGLRLILQIKKIKCKNCHVSFFYIYIYIVWSILCRGHTVASLAC